MECFTVDKKLGVCCIALLSMLNFSMVTAVEQNATTGSLESPVSSQTSEAESSPEKVAASAALASSAAASSPEEPVEGQVDVNLHILAGVEMQPHLAAIEKLQVESLKDYPYLWHADLEQEIKEINIYNTIPDARIMVATTDDEKTVIGYATCSPLFAACSEDQRLEFKTRVTDLDDYYCVNVAFLSPAHRREDLTRRGLKIFENLARELGYKKTCFYNVLRDDDDPRRPKEYSNHLGDIISEDLGYRNSLPFELEWATIQHDGSIKPNCVNPMILWEKSL